LFNYFFGVQKKIIEIKFFDNKIIFYYTKNEICQYLL